MRVRIQTQQTRLTWYHLDRRRDSLQYYKPIEPLLDCQVGDIQHPPIKLTLSDNHTNSRWIDYFQSFLDSLQINNLREFYKNLRNTGADLYRFLENEIDVKLLLNGSSGIIIFSGESSNVKKQSARLRLPLSAKIKKAMPNQPIIS